MNEERILKNLAAAARADAPPLVDVTERVLADLPAPARAPRAMLWAFAGACSTAAAAVIVLALNVEAAGQDPMGEFLQSITGMIQ